MSESNITGKMPDYKKAENDLLVEGLNRTYTERFHVMTALMKMSIMLNKASVKHKALPLKKE